MIASAWWYAYLRIVQYMCLHFQVHAPRVVPAQPPALLRCTHQAVNAANAQQLPIMLATKALPEMEGEEAGLLWAHRDAAGDAPIGAQYEQLGVCACSILPLPACCASTYALLWFARYTLPGTVSVRAKPRQLLVAHMRREALAPIFMRPNLSSIIGWQTVGQAVMLMVAICSSHGWWEHVCVHGCRWQLSTSTT